MRAERRLLGAALCALLTLAFAAEAWGQSRGTDGERGDKRRGVRSVTIPVTVKLPDERSEQQELQYIDALTVFEDGQPQEVLTIRGAPQTPLALAILIQDDLVSSVGNELRGIADFIRNLPPGSRVMVAYLRSGSLQVRQKFTNDNERAANSLRIPFGTTSISPYNPFTQLRDAAKRFEGQPIGRRAILLISDGLDLSRGASSSTPGQSVDLQRAIDESQRRGAAVYTIYSPTVGGTANNPGLVGNGQGALNRLAEETGGHAFFQGSGAPVSFSPFLRELRQMLSRQFALTYLATNPDKGFHRIRIESEMARGGISHPSGNPR